MMLLRRDYQKYPRFTNYVKYRFTDLWKVTAIREAFREYGQLSTSRLRKALRWGSYPLVTIKDMPKTKIGSFTAGVGSGEIKIATRVVEDFEEQNEDAYAETVDGKKIYLAGVVLLHELVHWADDKDGVPYWRQKKKNSMVRFEAGKLFEKAVYGHVVPVPGMKREQV